MPPLAALALYAPTLGFGFVWDDPVLIGAPALARLDVAGVLLRPGNGLEYLPVRDLSWMVDRVLFGEAPRGYHAANLFWFALGLVAIQALFRRLWPGGGVLGPFLATLVFAFHPLQVEPVAFVTGRNALLALVTTAAALASFDVALAGGPRSRLAWWLSLALVPVALLSKATAACLPVLIVLLAWYRQPSRGLMGALRTGWAHVGVAVPVVLLHGFVAVTRGVAAASPGMSLLERAATVLGAPFFYVWKFLWPVGLTTEYTREAVTSPWPVVAVGSVGVWVGLAWALRRGPSTWPTFALWAYLACLLPVANLVPTHPVFADRYAQLGLVWLSGLGVWALLALPRVPEALRSAIPVALALALAFVGAQQLPRWQDDESLFRHAARDPHAFQSQTNLATVLWNQGRSEAALEVFAQAERARPSDYGAPLHRGLHARNRGRSAEAERHFREASGRTGHGVFVADIELGHLLRSQGRRDEARAAYERAWERRETSPMWAQTVAEIERRLRALGGRPAR